MYTFVATPLLQMHSRSFPATSPPWTLLMSQTTTGCALTSPACQMATLLLSIHKHTGKLLRPPAMLQLQPQALMHPRAPYPACHTHLHTLHMAQLLYSTPRLLGRPHKPPMSLGLCSPVQRGSRGMPQMGMSGTVSESMLGMTEAAGILLSISTGTQMCM